MKLVCFFLLPLAVGTSCDSRKNISPVFRGPEVHATENSFPPEISPWLMQTHAMQPWHDVHDILHDREGNTWFATVGEGVYRYDGKLFTRFTDKNGLADNFVYSMLEDKDGTIWFGTANGVSRYDGHALTTFPVPETGSLSRYWLVSSLDAHYAAHLAPSSRIINCILQDKDGVLWFGTSNGLYRYDGKHTAVFLENGEENCGDMYGNGTQHIYQDREDNIWISTTGRGLYRLDKQATHNPCITGTCKHTEQDKWKHDNVVKDQFMRITAKGMQSDLFVFAFLEDKKGQLWLGTSLHGICRYADGELVPLSVPGAPDSGSVSVMLEDRDGNIWFGTSTRPDNPLKGSGLYCYNGKSMLHYTPDDGLAGNTVTCLLQDASGRIWAGSDGAGLAVYDPQTKKFTHYTAKDGLSHDYISTLSEDGNGGVWIGTWNVGLTLYDGKTFTNLTRAGKLE